jgi:hypothetical protein
LRTIGVGEPSSSRSQPCPQCVSHALPAGDHRDRHRPLDEAHVAIDDLVDELAEHERDEQVERGEVSDRALAERPDNDQHQGVDGNRAGGGEQEFRDVHGPSRRLWAADEGSQVPGRRRRGELDRLRLREMFLQRGQSSEGTLPAEVQAHCHDATPGSGTGAPSRRSGSSRSGSDTAHRYRSYSCCDVPGLTCRGVPGSDTFAPALSPAGATPTGGCFREGTATEATLIDYSGLTTC